MPTSIRGKSRSGFTLIELSVVLFVLGLMLWLVAPRLMSAVEPGRSTVFRDLSAGSEAAFDTALFEKREVRLRIDPAAGTYRFHLADDKESREPRAFGDRLTITGIILEGDERPLDILTEIRYLPGGRLPAARIFFRDSGSEGEPTEWTLRLNPTDGTVDVLEGKVVKDV